MNGIAFTTLLQQRFDGLVMHENNGYNYCLILVFFLASQREGRLVAD